MCCGAVERLGEESLSVQIETRLGSDDRVMFARRVAEHRNDCDAIDYLSNKLKGQI